LRKNKERNTDFTRSFIVLFIFCIGFHYVPIFIQYIAIIFAYFCVFCRKTYVLPLQSHRTELGLPLKFMFENRQLFAENGLEINLIFFANVLRVIKSLVTPYMCIVNSISKGQ